MKFMIFNEYVYIYIHVYIYICMGHSAVQKKWHNIVNQLYFNYKNKKIQIYDFLINVIFGKLNVKLYLKLNFALSD